MIFMRPPIRRMSRVWVRPYNTDQSEEQRRHQAVRSISMIAPVIAVGLFSARIANSTRAAVAHR